MNEKYILCIPRECGFNDILCQIFNAYKFALNSNRILLVDTSLSGLADSFSNYFKLITPDKRIILDFKFDDIVKLNMLTCFPKNIEGKVEYIYYQFGAFGSKKNQKWAHFNSILKIFQLVKYVFNNLELNAIIKKSKFILFFLTNRGNYYKINFSNLENHPAQLIVHHMSGGGEESIQLLSILEFKNEIKKAIQKKIEYKRFDYDAIHVRNTDYRSDFKTFFENINPAIFGRRVLLCTDDSGVINDALKILNQSEVIIINKHFPNSKKNNIPIHFQWHLSKEKIRSNNISMLAELLAMANAKRIFYPDLIDNIHKTSVSGFSLLAKNLNSRPDLVNQLMRING